MASFGPRMVKKSVLIENRKDLVGLTVELT
jgi:hypothetical protein